MMVWNLSIIRPKIRTWQSGSRSKQLHNSTESGPGREQMLAKSVAVGATRAVGAVGVFYEDLTRPP